MTEAETRWQHYKEDCQREYKEDAENEAAEYIVRAILPKRTSLLSERHVPAWRLILQDMQSIFVKKEI